MSLESSASCSLYSAWLRRVEIPLSHADFYTPEALVLQRGPRQPFSAEQRSPMQLSAKREAPVLFPCLMSI